MVRQACGDHKHVQRFQERSLRDGPEGLRGEHHRKLNYLKGLFATLNHFYYFDDELIDNDVEVALYLDDVNYLLWQEELLFLVFQNAGVQLEQRITLLR